MQTAESNWWDVLLQGPVIGAVVAAVVAIYLYQITFGNRRGGGKYEKGETISEKSAILEPDTRNFIIVNMRNSGDEALNVNSIRVVDAGVETVIQDFKLLISYNDPYAQAPMTFYDINGSFEIKPATFARFALFVKDPTKPLPNSKMKVLIQSGMSEYDISICDRSDTPPALIDINGLTLKSN